MPSVKYRARTESGAPDPVDLHVGSRLHLRRTLMGLSQSELARATNVTFQQIQKYETGFNRISASRLYRAAEVLDVPISFFFDGLPGQAQTDPVISNLPLEGYSRELLEMMRNYHRIRDQDIRYSLCLLIRTLAIKE